MHDLPFDHLPAYKPRRFVPEAADLADLAHVAPLFDQLEARGLRCETVAGLEEWLIDWSELSAAIEEESGRRFIAMTSHTDDAAAEEAYLAFVEHVEPKVKPRQFALERVLIGHPLAGKLPQPRYQVFLRDVRNRVEIFRPENVALEMEEARLCQQYLKLSGSLTVSFRGEERTLDQMGKLMEEPDCAIRQEAWELVVGRRLRERDTFEDQFDALLKLRQRMAVHAGFRNYRDYAFRRMGRFDYGPADCEAFHEAIESEVMPVVRELQERRRAALGRERLRPWDMSVDPRKRAPLTPFETTDQLVAGVQAILEKLDSTLAGGFRQMHELRLLDLGNRPGKAPGGYEHSLSEARLPFIFMNAVGRQVDVEVLLHEAGHAFHALAARKEDLLAYRQGPPTEFAEVASMSMELLGNDLLEALYGPADAHRARQAHLEQLLTVLGLIALGDAFQHWIYTHLDHTRTERDEAWEALLDRFAGDIDWRGYEEVRPHSWHRQLHFFIVPFYFIEYGLAQFGALQVWANYRRDPAQALADYQGALALGGSRPLPELYAAAGCRFQFDKETIRELVALVRTELRLAPGDGAMIASQPEKFPDGC